MDIIVDAPILSFNNHKEIAAATHCGCYFCTEVYETKEIVEWTDYGRTAICPRCGIDAVVPGNVTREQLQEAHNRYLISL